MYFYIAVPKHIQSVSSSYLRLIYYNYIQSVMWHDKRISCWNEIGWFERQLQTWTCSIKNLVILSLTWIPAFKRKKRSSWKQKSKFKTSKLKVKFLFYRYLCILCTCKLTPRGKWLRNIVSDYVYVSVYDISDWQVSLIYLRRRQYTFSTMR